MEPGIAGPRAPRLPDPAPPAERPPLSVRCAQLVLFMQAACAAIPAVEIVVRVMTALHLYPGRAGNIAADFDIARFLIAAVALAVVTALLAVRLSRRPTRRVRQLAIAVEVTLACAGLLWCAGIARDARDATEAVTAFAGLIAAAVCLLAALALLSPRARQFFARAAG